NAGELQMRLERRDGQREARQNDEDRDREVPVEHPGRPERAVVLRVAAERAQVAVVEHHEESGQAADTVETYHSCPGPSGGRGRARGPRRVGRHPGILSGAAKRTRLYNCPISAPPGRATGGARYLVGVQTQREPLVS